MNASAAGHRPLINCLRFNDGCESRAAAGLCSCFSASGSDETKIGLCQFQSCNHKSLIKNGTQELSNGHSS